MAPTLLVIAALALAISVQGTLGGTIKCEDLNKDSCSYAVSGSGKRCVLDKGVSRNGLETFNCATSEITADKLSDFVETDECIKVCGVDRKALGISSDSLLDRNFAQSLCSNECYSNCHNIIDLYFNLAAGEGVFLPKFCEARKFNGRREMTETNMILSAGQTGLKALGPATRSNAVAHTIESLNEGVAMSPSPSAF